MQVVLTIKGTTDRSSMRCDHRLALEQFKHVSWHVLSLLPKMPLSHIFVLLPSWHKEISPRSPLRSLLWTPQLNQQPVHTVLYPSCCLSVSKLCPTLCNPMDCNTTATSGFHYLLEFTQSHVHWVSDAIQPSHPLWSPFLPAFNLSQHQSLFQCVSSSNQVVKVLELHFIISPSNEYSRMISFKIDWFDLFAVQGTLKSLLYLTVHFIFLKATNVIRIDTSYLFGTPSYIMQAPFGRSFSILFISLSPESVETSTR